jgi:hypothetical protein
MATKKIKRFQEGGMSDKDRGLEASKEDKVGFFERLRMGNIDDEGSEAYRRFGAGRGKAERTPVETMAPSPVRQSADAAMPERSQDDSGAFNEAGSGVVNDTKPDMPMQRLNAAASKPAAPKPAPAKPPAMQEQSYRRTGGASADDRASSPRVAPVSNPNYSNEGRGREMTKKQQVEREIDLARPSTETIQKGMESAALPGVGLKALSAAAKKLATPKLSKYAQETLPAPTKRLGYDKAGAVAKRRSDRASKQREEMLEENARRYGLDKESPGYEAASGAVRKEMGGKDFSFKKGGRIKSAPKKMSSGGSVSPASKRADGIATRGKTRCKIC